MCVGGGLLAAHVRKGRLFLLFDCIACHNTIVNSDLGLEGGIILVRDCKKFSYDMMRGSNWISFEYRRAGYAGIAECLSGQLQRRA